MNKNLQESDNEQDEIDGEIWISSDGKRIMLYRFYAAEIDLPFCNNEALQLDDEEFRFIFNDWVKVGNL
jgi:hypothetical protein